MATMELDTGIYDALRLCEESCIEFVRKVECGEARSKRSYAQMKEALEALQIARDAMLTDVLSIPPLDTPPIEKSGMPKYRKKPVVVEAKQWIGTNLQEIIAFTGRHESARDWTWEEFETIVATEGLKIFTLEGPLKASIGDYIIKGVKGEFYPCKPDIFEATYEPVEE